MERSNYYLLTIDSLFSFTQQLTTLSISTIIITKMTTTGTNKKDLLQLCSQLKDSVDQLQRGITGRRKRNRKSGASGRSRKTQKRKVAAAASANALANVRTDNTSMTNSVADAGTNIISPVKDVYLTKN